MLCCAVVIVLRLVRVHRYVVVHVVLCCVVLCCVMVYCFLSVIPGVRYKRVNSIKEEHHRDS